MVYKRYMNKIIYTFAALSLISSPVYANNRDKEPDPFEEEMRNIKIKSVREYSNSSIRFDRTRDDSRYRFQRERAFCVTRKVVDEYGYVHYFERCR